MFRQVSDAGATEELLRAIFLGGNAEAAEGGSNVWSIFLVGELSIEEEVEGRPGAVLHSEWLLGPVVGVS